MASPTLLRQRIRIALDMSEAGSAVVADTGNAARIYRGYDCQLEFLFKYQGQVLLISDFLSVRMEIKTSARTGDPLIDKSVSGASLDSSQTEDAHAEWDAGTKQHAIFTLTPAETNNLTVTGTETEFFLTVSATTTAATGSLTVPLGFGPIIAEETGLGGTAAAVPNPPTAYTKEEADARFLGGAIQHVNGAGVTITLTHATNGKQIQLGVGDDGELSINTISP